MAEDTLFDTTDYIVPYLSEKKTLDATPTHEVTEEGICAIFDHWKATCRTSGRGRPPILSKKRRRAIEKAIGLYGIEYCMHAIEGVLLSEWHQGVNPGGLIYDDVELILRDSEHIEMFASLADDPLQEWLNE